MPTYEYACRHCGHTFEIVQSFQDDALTVCPECDGPLRKVFTAPAITFKGSGFYATDHGKKSKPAPSEKKGADASTTKKDASSSKDGASSSSTTPTSKEAP
jgi:putative FmdB family regulatory protein